VLERSRIAAEMKDLDQPSRASLRKYGVRFGAYHIFLPALLKPAARGLASLLWALKHDAVDLSALTGAQHLAASGRTSFPADKALDADAYRVLGYRLCGDRAIRVDILERLADLIRPALSWRPGMPGEKPAGAFDGRSFTATQAMTSLTGAAGEDFASILRALGYRMEKRPPLPPEPTPVAEPAAAGTTVVASAPEDVAADGQPAPAESAAPEIETASDAVDSPAVEAAAPAQADTPAPPAETAAEPAAERLPDVPFVADETAEPVAAEAPAADDAAAAAETPAADAAAVAAEAAPDQAAPAAPELVEVWRPGGRSEERRPRHQRHRQHRGPDKAAAPQAGGDAAPAVEGERVRHGRPRRDRDGDRARRGEAAAAAPQGTEARQPREDRGNRPPRERFKDQDRNEGRGKGRFDKGKRDGRRDDRDRGGALRTYATSASPREREKAADPNSPFAKLAALKDQLAGNRKD
jgi:ATP-dependent RNA helicase SUPV3L1/SUV3